MADEGKPTPYLYRNSNIKRSSSDVESNFVRPTLPVSESIPAIEPSQESRQSTLPFTPPEVAGQVQVTSSQNGSASVQVIPIENGDAAVKEEMIHTMDNSIATFLNSIGLSAYIDNFHQMNLVNMSQLDDFTIEDLQKMKIGTAHRNKIWKALVDTRSSPVPITDSQVTPLQHDISSASTISMSSQGSLSQNSNYCPGYYEVTRYTFKHTISLTKEYEREVSPKRQKQE